jgi:PhnB protein
MSKAFVSPYLFFGGRCEEALDFYRETLAAEVGLVIRFGESPDPPPPGTIAPGFEHKIMHAAFTVGATSLMASDGCAENPLFAGFSLSLWLPTTEEVERVFAAMADDGTVQMPLAETFWSPCFGTLTDRFGVAWMISVQA